jgi:uncharacterized protein YjiS (DUF1127 family)
MNVNATEPCKNQGFTELEIQGLGAHSPDWGDMYQDYGRRIEPDRSWTVYHVFTGATAELANQSMTGLSEADATAKMLFLNAHNGERRKTAKASPPALMIGTTAHTPTGPAMIISGIFQVIMQPWSQLQDRRRARANHRSLDAFTLTMLKDIGLGHSEIMSMKYGNASTRHRKRLAPLAALLRMRRTKRERS